MTDPLHGTAEDVRFDHVASADLARTCRNAATSIEDQAGSRASWVQHGLVDFAGYYSQVFSENGRIQAADAGGLVIALRNVATAAEYLAGSATKEQERRETARAWKHRRDNRNALDHIHDFFMGEEDPPFGPPDPPEPQYPPIPAVAPRTAPTSGSSSSGTSSARPGHLRTFADNSEGANDSLSSYTTSLRTALDAFTSGCGWGTLSAEGVLTAFGSYLTANGNDVTWARTVAAAFEEAGDGSIVTLSNASITAALQAGGVSAERTPLEIEPPQAFGAPPTTGYSDDPVNTATGNFLEPEADLTFPGAASSLRLTRMYNAMDDATGAFGPGWSSWTEAGLVFDDDAAWWVLADGRRVLFPRQGSGWARATTEAYWLDAAADGHVVTDNRGGRWRFDNAGRLVETARGAGTAVTLEWSGTRLAAMVHERGRRIDLDWADERVVRAASDDGRQVTYDYDDAGRLVAVTSPGGTRRYAWNDAGLIATVTDADGVVEVDNTYDEHGRVVAQVSRFGRTSRYSYLPGRVTVVSDPDGTRANTWLHDAKGRLVGVVDALGHRQSMAYDGHGHLVMVTARDGSLTVAEHDERGREVTRALPSGARVETRWDELDRVTEVAVVSGDQRATTRYEYAGDDRNPSTWVDPEGGTTRLAWAGNLLTSVTDPTGVRLEFTHDARGDLVAVTDADGATARIERDALGLPTAAVTPEGHRTTFAHDERGILASRTDPDGGTWRFEHTAGGRLVATVDPLGHRTERTLSQHGEATAVTDALGLTTARTLDDLGLISALTLPDGSRWEYAHDALSRLVATTDPEGNTWRAEFDEQGLPTALIDPTGRAMRATASGSTLTVGPDGVDGSTSVTTDQLGRIVSTQAPDGGHRLTRYDRCGRPVEFVDPTGGVTALRRDAAGRVLQLTRPDGSTTTYAYDRCGRLSTLTDAAGSTWRFAYDKAGRLAVETDPTGADTRLEWDACGRLAARTAPGHGRTAWEYDLAGRVVAIRDARFGRRRFTWDAAGRVTAVTDALGRTTTHTYDALGRVVATTDPLGHTTHRSWTPLGRLASQTDALGRELTAGYDGAGRQLWQRNATGEHLAWTHDAAGRPESASVDGRTVAAFVRDPATRTVTVFDRTDPDREVTHTLVWDAAGHLVERTRDGRGVRWTRDALGRVTALTTPAGTTHIERDALGRPVAIDAPHAGRVQVDHDAAGRLVGARTTDGEQSWRWADGHVVAHTLRSGAGTATTTVTRDADGRITALDRDGDTTAFEHDAAGQLLAARSAEHERTWVWDAAGRLASETADGATVEHEHDAAGQLLATRSSAGETRYTHDAAGRRTGQHGPDGDLRLTWSALGWLTGITGPAGATRVHVDALGELARLDDAELFWDTPSPTPHPVAVGDRPVTVAPGATAVGDDWLAAGWRPGRGTGSDPWAALLGPAVGGGTALGPVGLLAVDGLEWLGARPYDPATRSFLAVDPRDPVPGSAWASNPYSYAGNDPLHALDPLGLSPVSDADLQAYAAANGAGFFAAAGEWLSDNWQGALMVVAGAALMFTPLGPTLGVGLISAGGNAIIQQATTGEVNWGQVALSGVLGAAGGGFASWASAASTGGTAALRTAVLVNGGVGGASGGISYAVTTDNFTWQGLAASVSGGIVAGSVGGAAGPAGGTIARTVFGQSSTGALAIGTSAVINGMGSSAGNLTSQMIANPGEPINWASVGVSGAFSTTTSVVTSQSWYPVGQSTGTSTLSQMSYFGTRTPQGLVNFGAPNTQAIWGGVSSGTVIGIAENPLQDLVTP